MSAAHRKLENLETSKLWKQAVKLAEHARQFAEVLPHHEHYAIADPLYRNATLVTSDIAMALGKGTADAAFDYRFARGHLFMVKSLVLVSQHYELVSEVKHLLNEINHLQNLLDELIRTLESDTESPRKEKR